MFFGFKTIVHTPVYCIQSFLCVYIKACYSMLQCYSMGACKKCVFCIVQYLASYKFEPIKKFFFLVHPAFFGRYCMCVAVAGVVIEPVSPLLRA